MRQLTRCSPRPPESPVFLGPYIAGASPATQEELALRANAYLEAGADCVYPIAFWERDPLRHLMAEIRGR